MRGEGQAIGEAPINPRPSRVETGVRMQIAHVSRVFGRSGERGGYKNGADNCDRQQQDWKQKKQSFCMRIIDVREISVNLVCGEPYQRDDDARTTDC